MAMNKKGWISDNSGNHIKLSAITAITVDSDLMNYKTIVHFGTGSVCMCEEPYCYVESREQCEKVSDGIFEMIQAE